MLTVSQSAKLLKVTSSRVRALISAGTLPARKVGNAWLLQEEDVLQRLESRPKSGRPKAGEHRLLDYQAGDDPYADFSEFYRQAKELYSLYPSGLQMMKMESPEERRFAVAVADFFCQQKQRELVSKGVF